MNPEDINKFKNKGRDVKIIKKVDINIYLFFYIDLKKNSKNTICLFDYKL